MRVLYYGEKIHEAWLVTRRNMYRYLYCAQRAHHEFSQPKNSPIRMNGTTRIFLIGVDYIVGDTFFAGALSEALQPG